MTGHDFDFVPDAPETPAPGGGGGTCGSGGGSVAGDVGDSPVGVEVPEELVGTFIAEVFEDAERRTSWREAVDAMVAPEARDAWEALAPPEQVEEVLTVAAGYDEAAIEHLEAIPTDRREPTDEMDHTFQEAMRLRRNADMLRNAVADAYATGHVTDDELVAVVEDAGFETNRIARREDRLEEVATAYSYDFKPYGGTLMNQSTDDGDDSVEGACRAW